MQVTVKKWGNCAAVRLPAAVMKAARLSIDQPVDVSESDGIITIRPAARRRSLTDLIAETPSFDGVEGWNDAPPVGREREAFGE